MPYCQRIELEEKASRDLVFMLHAIGGFSLLADALLRGSSVPLNLPW